LTACAAHDIIVSNVKHSVWRATIGLVLAPYVALSSAIAPAHIHEADADHPRATLHRHLELHHAEGHDVGHAQLADDDDHVVWLDAIVVHQAAFQVTAPQDVLLESFEPVSPTCGWTAIVNYDTAPPHGPPRASPSLRAPPCLPA
jgi:hypothetical protein